MTYGAFTARDFAAYDLQRRTHSPFPQALLCALALTLSASAGLAVLYALPPTRSLTIEASQPTAHPMHAANAIEGRRVALPPAVAPLRRYAALLDPTPTYGRAPVTFAQSAPLLSRFEAPRPQVAAVVTTPPASDLEAEAPRTDDQQIAEASIVLPLPMVSPVQEVPMPAPRPALLAAAETTAPTPMKGRRAMQPQAAAPVATAAAEPSRPGFFEKIFGAAQPSPSVLAYATPEDSGRGGLFGARPAASDAQTAVYDISAHTVYLPDGTRLEAHSGLGASKDDPRSVTERMRGATPPNTYELTLREALFHGVRALRLTPVAGTTYGRGGLLAHTFMLGPHGDSNGCVVFRDYKAFLDAYDSGRVRRLLVVSRLG